MGTLGEGRLADGTQVEDKAFGHRHDSEDIETLHVDLKARQER